jgi:hypothetical protein
MPVLGGPERWRSRIVGSSGHPSPVSCSSADSGIGVIKAAFRSLIPAGRPIAEARRASQLASPEPASGQPRPRRAATLPCIRKSLSPAISLPEDLGTALRGTRLTARLLSSELLLTLDIHFPTTRRHAQAVTHCDGTSHYEPRMHPLRRANHPCTDRCERGVNSPKVAPRSTSSGRRPGEGTAATTPLRQQLRRIAPPVRRSLGITRSLASMGLPGRPLISA